MTAPNSLDICALACRYKAALNSTGADAATMPRAADVAIAICIAARNAAPIDWPVLVGLPPQDLVAACSYIHDRIDRRTGALPLDLAPPAGVIA